MRPLEDSQDWSKMYYSYEINMYVLVKSDSREDADAILDKTVESVDKSLTVLNCEIEHIGDRN